MGTSRIIIGRRDRIDLPGLGYKNVRAKVDTGAFGCALHCSEIEVIQKAGKEVLSFVPLDPGYSAYRNEKCYFEHYRDKLVKNSGGESEHRYLISTPVVIFGKKIPTEFTLTDRSLMKYPVLLGRKFLRRHFIVDVNQKDVSYKRKRNRHK